MAEPMSVLNQRPEPSLIEEVALLKGIEPAFVEKDWLVVQIIKAITTIQIEGFEFVFSGGTCLSKAHSLLQRFSEDIDFRVVAEAPRLSRKSLSMFKNIVVEALRMQGFAIEDEQVKARDSNRFFSIDVYYESNFPVAKPLRPHILIEITVRNTQLPRIPLPVSSFVNELSKQPAEVAVIACIDPVESAADKLSAIAWRIPDRVRQGEDDDPSLVRHIHDLALLKEKALACADFAALVQMSMGEDEERAKHVSLAGLAAAEKFRRMLQVLETDLEYPKEYDRFVKGVSYATDGSTPDFAAAMQSVRALVEAVTA